MDEGTQMSMNPEVDAWKWSTTMPDEERAVYNTKYEQGKPEDNLSKRTSNGK
ncbi:MAG: hypothetical protein ACK40G_18195 [Cytophagaceae bacterium]